MSNKYKCLENNALGQLLNKTTSEGCIYVHRDRKFAVKLYRPNFSRDKMAREFKFLNKFQKPQGTPESRLVVPILYSKPFELFPMNAFIMEYLKDYITLKKFGATKKQYSDIIQNKVLSKLAETRYKIGRNIEYEDLHSENIMVKILLGNDKVFVRIIDPGNIHKHDRDTPIWIDSVQKIVKSLGMTRTDVGRIIKKGNQNEIKKLFKK
jgi:hypothetical protein